MKQYIRHILLGVLFFAGVGVSAQNSGALQPTTSGYSARVSLQPDSVTIGETFNMWVDVQFPEGANVTLPAPGDTLLQHIEILHSELADSAHHANGEQSVRMHYSLIALDSGEFALSPRALFKHGAVFDTLYADPAFIHISLAPADSSGNIRDIKPIYTIPVTLDEVLPWVALLLLLSALVWLIVRIVKKTRHREPLFGKAQPILPPHLEALRQLDQLRQEKLWQEGQTKAYYTRLTDIVRVYLDNRFGLSSREQVTREILASLRATGFENNLLINRLEYIFSIADMVKFAKATPLADENETALLNAYYFVNNTQPQREGATGELSGSENRKSE